VAKQAAPRTGVMARLAPEVAGALRLAAALGAAGAFGPFCLVLLQVQIYTLVVPTGDVGTAVGLAAGFAVAAALMVALSHLRDAALLAVGHRVARRLASPALLAATARGGTEPAGAAARAIRDVEEVRRGVSGSLSGLLLDAATVPLLLLLLAVFHWAFAAFAAACALGALLLGLAADRATRASLAGANGAAAEGALLVADAARCAEVVEAMGLLPALVRRWAVSLARGASDLRRAQRGARIAAAAAATLYGFAASGALVVGVLAIVAGDDVGYGLLAGLLLTARVMEPFSRLGPALEEAASVRAAWARLDALLREADAAPPRETRAYPCPHGRLTIEDATFAHPGMARPLLRGIRLAVEPGEVVAVSGPPGCGKSSLLGLVLGTRKPVAGGVFLDGHATAHWDREDLARHIGFLPQDPALTEGSVAEAIARLQPEPDMAAVLRAARLAGAERMIAGLPDGFATRLGGDLRLSMGQRQRIALARAVYGAPRLVVLDEPAAFLDAEGEAAVARLIGALASSGVSVLLVSHRESLLVRAGRVLTLRDGALVPASGSPRRLLAAPAAPAPRRLRAPAGTPALAPPARALVRA
jgi:ATP-binding cassette, subfamily C, type I secretion system permease/ATPase